MKLLIVFIVLNILNVIIQTVKSIATVKCGKVVASVVNALAYGLYTIVTVYIMCELDLYLKAGIVAVCNLIGVYVVKLIEEKTRKDKLWKVEATVHNQYTENLNCALKALDISCNYITDIGQYTVFNIFCENQEQSKQAKKLLDAHNAKYFVSESKIL